jgi:hypothetical protein
MSAEARHSIPEGAKRPPVLDVRDSRDGRDRDGADKKSDALEPHWRFAIDFATD